MDLISHLALAGAELERVEELRVVDRFGGGSGPDVREDRFHVRNVAESVDHAALLCELEERLRDLPQKTPC